MVTLKYYEKIKSLQRLHRPDDITFDLQALKGNWASRIQQKLIQSIWIHSLLRQYWPILRLGRLVIVTKYDDVKEILEHQDVFETPYGLEMTEMAGGTNFVLGMRDEDTDGANAYRQMRDVIRQAFQDHDIEKIRDIAKAVSEQAVDRSAGRIDVIQDLIIRVPTRICKDYYGLDIRDEESFAEWTFALSMLFFADPTGDKKVRDMALLAAERLGRLIDASAALARERARGGPLHKTTVLDRLIELSELPNSVVDDAMIRSILMGMATGFVPTNTLAAGNILDVLLTRQEAFAESVRAALADKDDDLERCLFEAMRFKPPLNPGLFRYTTADFTIAKGTSRETLIRQGSTVLAATASAMHDNEEIEQPGSYLPNRLDERELLFGASGMLFGYQLHKCIGQAIARAQITQMFKVLLRQKKWRPVAGRLGKMQRIGPFPYRMELEIGEIEGPAEVAMVTVCAKLAEHVDETAIESALDALGNPVNGAFKSALDKGGYVHFLSINIVPGENPAHDRNDRKPGHILLELTADGKEADVIDLIAADAGQTLRPIFKQACGLSDREHLAEFLKRHSLVVKPRLASTLGLTFCGTPWFSCRRIKNESRLQEKIAAIVSRNFGHTPLKVLDTAREEIWRDTSDDFTFARTPAPIPFLDRAAAPWNKEGDITGLRLWFRIAIDAIKNSRYISTVLAALTLLFAYILFNELGSPWYFSAPFSLILGTAFALLLFSAASAVFGFFLILRLNSLEMSDHPRDLDPVQDCVADIARRENAPGFIQNHMFAISTMKKGWARRVALFVSLFIIEKLATMATFRPGFLSNIGTIHFARWVRLPNTDKLLFFSNYAGSWESYLEDFITKAHNGLTAVWSNTLDFPVSRDLFRDGATDGDRFKRWARRQQRPTLCWYSGYPSLTTDRIRTNALIRDGLSRAQSESDAAAWLSLFNSLPRPASALEFDEIQTLIFGGMGKLEASHCMLIRFNHETKNCRSWLDDLRKRLAFGERMPKEATALGLSASGLRLLELKQAAGSAAGDQARDPLTSFPFAFSRGMADETRSRVLGDTGDNAPPNWNWGNKAAPVDAILLIYAANESELDKACSRERDWLHAHKHTATEISLKLGRKIRKFSAEPFGFADGISQPVMRGTKRYYQGIAECHVVAPGELILGYPDQRGKFPPTPQVYAGDDPNHFLPNPPERLPLRFPEFDPGSTRSKAPRDLGRNGSYLVVRQIRQDTEGFNNYLELEVARLRKDHGDTVWGSRIDRDWLAAKMIGRWPGGASLVRSPDKRNAEADNDFYFGVEDPQGYRCPFSAHIRRANPRDAFNAGDVEQVSMITNRHRVLRVGRPYEDGEEKGLMFMCINADIERQFEFIQQTWLQAPSFSGLANEIDPMIGLGSMNRQFSIPTPDGTIVVHGHEDFTCVRGGGYFFLPSRSALEFLSHPQ